MVELTRVEWKWAWKWDLRSYTIKVGENIAYLYNQERKMVTASPFICQREVFNLKNFTMSCIQTMTRKPKDEFKEHFDKLYRVKEKLAKLYNLPIESEKFYEKYHRLIKLRKKVSFLLSVKSNDLGYYYACISCPFPDGKIELLNTNPVELLQHLFLIIEFSIEKDALPYTLSQSWYEDYKFFGNRLTPDATARYNVESTYHNYIYDRIESCFRSDTQTGYIPIFELFSRLKKENKFYILDVLLNDGHFRIDERDFVIFEPTSLRGMYYGARYKRSGISI